jgi:hypothetical protein
MCPAGSVQIHDALVELVGHPQPGEVRNHAKAIMVKMTSAMIPRIIHNAAVYADQNMILISV